jgi:BlaI family transcriptional regulator, penicillinase repressor
MAKRAALSRAEMQVVHLVWKLDGATVREVLEALPDTRHVDYKTVQTYLRRLEAKGYLNSKREGRTCVYSAKVRPGLVIRDTVNDFVGRLFGGNPLPLMEHLIQEEGLSGEDIDHLREMLDQLEAEGDVK